MRPRRESSWRGMTAGWCAAAAIAGALALASRPEPARAQGASNESRVDAVFARWTRATPGCAVGVAEAGRTVLTRAYGVADLEHDIPNTPETIFEAGSVSKQFTAAAVLRLVADGKVSLDDPVRKYVPEVPDYGPPITVRHLLSHTSGLRDWGSLYGLAGAPRGSRTYTHAHVLDMLSRQRSLNFAPGTRWSYSNSGYNLAAVIVGRVSGTSFAAFSAERLFKPLGLTRTSWRDDHTRLVRGRAQAYSGAPASGFRLDMPFEDVHGNGGLLTTVGDLLRWNEHLSSPGAGWAASVKDQETPAKLADGRALHYGLGLFSGTYQGLREIYHSGSTAGYRAFLTRFPDQRLSVAVLCNATSGDATAAARAVADIYLGDRRQPSAPPSRPLPEARGPLVDVQADASYQPSPDALAELAGDYVSDEIEATLVVKVRNGGLTIERRPATTIALRPHATDRFQAAGGLGLVTFRRSAGRVTALSVTQDRVWDLRFERR